jgi:hypothetical protein
MAWTGTLHLPLPLRLPLPLPNKDRHFFSLFRRMEFGAWIRSQTLNELCVQI